jgi:hypothetical protein
MLVLREFLYRRDDLVSQFLEQLEGGVYDEEKVTQKDQAASGIGASIGSHGAKASVERKKQGDREAAMTLRQTASSRFDRLYSLLRDGHAIQPLDAFDDAIWEQLGRNEIVELDADLTLAPGVAEMASARAIGAVGPLIDIMRNLPASMRPEGFDPAEADKISDQLPVIQGFTKHFEDAPIPCIFTPVRLPRYKFFAELSREHLVVDLDDLEGEVTVLAKIQRMIPKGRPETLGGGILPQVALNREQRRKQKTEQPMTVRLSHPAAVVTAIGVYR